MKVAYITKYALTFGIYSTKGEISDDTFIQKAQQRGEFDQYFHGNEWHLSKEEAMAHAEEMRIRKLKSLDKQIKKISLLKFDVK
ncbi:hypothetical protein [Pantoea sp. 1B4]|uniref:hypothetical protein n=1 Tax=Pantoea sp. 1B4 TaxID=2804760 RepID=UPI001AA558CB|nr:hypothetical protein [Pantoea sp. 1B4]MBN1088078.1 hypothetical protein [Pantoea sp. 1B4]